ncbi:MAG: transporter related protein [Paenibacillaceae bacterium]|jgi:putative ABC transport system ATP-binding protein|nr:transporter related protein [Paenibacillaceae bacterium]
MLEGRGLTLMYDLKQDEPTYALRNVDFTLRPGEMVGVVGPSGSGKSSLLHVLSGLVKPTSGTVFLENRDMESLPEKERAKRRLESFGFVFQRHFLIHYMTVWENVLVPLNRTDHDAAQRASKLLDALDMGALRGRRPPNLSGGQCQRVAIARALVHNPRYILADEPTASLDRAAANEVMKLLKERSGEAGVLLVTHDHSILEQADRIVQLWDGRVKKG